MTGNVTHTLLGSLTLTVVTWVLYQVSKVLYGELTSPWRHLHGPRNFSLLFGNFEDILKDESIFHGRWIQEYGRAVRFKGFFSLTRLYIADTKAVNHILMNNYDYQKSNATRYDLSRMVGTGLLVVEEDEHKQQRKIMNHAFGPAHIREHTEVFIEKAIQLRDIWADESSKHGGPVRIDVLAWLNKMTLDVIGLSGFNYKFEALANKQTELNGAVAAMFKADSKPNIISMLKAQIPCLRFLSTESDTQIRESQETLARIGNQLLRKSIAAATVGEKRTGGDLLSVLVRANMATDLPESQRLSDRDVLAQVPTFIMAGHETTSCGTTWALFALAQDQRVQSKLRDELLTVDTDNPTMDQLIALPYLDMVVRETMRLHAPVPATSKLAMKDDVLPLSAPIIDCKGRVHHSIRVKKGSMILIPIAAINRDRSIWGGDADQFRPERWASIPEAASTVPGVWGNMLTFLGGPRACIGYRFSLVEMKAILFTIVRAFEFQLAVSVKDIIKKTSIVQRPVLVTDPDGDSQMPLLIKLHNRLP